MSLLSSVWRLSACRTQAFFAAAQENLLCLPNCIAVNARLIKAAAALTAAFVVAGCHSSPPSPALPPGPHEIAAQANALFLHQKTFDPWLLTSTDKNNAIPAYLSDGKNGFLISAKGEAAQRITAGLYHNGQLQTQSVQGYHAHGGSNSALGFPHQQLNMRTGVFQANTDSSTAQKPMVSSDAAEDYDITRDVRRDWPKLWNTSDVMIDGDPEAQQVTHANLFYLLSSTYPGSRHSLPPLGLSSPVYGGHIFWDAEVWMLPALLPQHPEYAKPIIDYRFDRLAQAKRNAKAHGFVGAEYPWESADTGAEVAPAEFAQERHITADVAWAAWQYYLWTGDRKFLQTEGWPLLRACADYWDSRATPDKGGRFHIRHVLGPDETAGVVDDDAYTIGVVRESLDAAMRCARLLSQPVNPKWQTVHDRLFVPHDAERGIPAGSLAAMSERFSAKQADALLLLHPLNTSMDSLTAGRMLDFYSAHTIKNGPAMTDSIHAVIAARLGRGPQSLDFFHASYRPFMRGPWDAFSEKRTTNNVYFLTGMAGCVQSVLYGFAGLNVAQGSARGRGTRLAGDGDVSLWAAPRLPPGWKRLTVQGIRFRGRSLTLSVRAGNKVLVK